MGTFEDIKNTELKIREARENILIVEKHVGKDKFIKQLKKLEFDQVTAVMNFLETNNKTYYKLIQENFDLLINDKIEFNVTKEKTGYMWKSHAKRFIGQVNENGYFYCNTTETDFVFLDFQRGFYPLSYKGLINYLGEADVYIDKKGYKFIGSRVPQKFVGSIDEYGNVYFETKVSYFETFGDTYVNNIVADFFSGECIKRKRFLDNKFQLKQLIEAFRKEL